ncbi:MAG: amino acid-binding protein [Lachnospiraceae bacterium]|nr:amino acid-binding protein [Lachnospiraceae bacterium]
MIMNQISVFIENKEGNLLTVSEILKNNNIDIRTLSLADTSEYGMLRMIVSDEETAKKVLKEAGFPVSITQVVAVRTNNKVGYMHDLLEKIPAEIANIEYMYTLPSDEGSVLIIKVADIEKVEKAISE